MLLASLSREITQWDCRKAAFSLISLILHYFQFSPWPIYCTPPANQLVKDQPHTLYSRLWYAETIQPTDNWRQSTTRYRSRIDSRIPIDTDCVRPSCFVRDGIIQFSVILVETRVTGNNANLVAKKLCDEKETSTKVYRSVLTSVDRNAWICRFGLIRG